MAAGASFLSDCDQPDYGMVRVKQPPFHGRAGRRVVPAVEGADREHGTGPQT